MKQDSLQHRLRGWASRQGPASDRLEALTGRISRQARQLTVYQADPPRTEPAFLVKAKYALAGALAAAAILVVCMRNHPVENGAVPNGSGANAGDSASGMQALYQEATRLFPKQLRWISQSNGEVGLGVESDSTVSFPDTAPVLIRLVVLSRKIPEQQWQQAWTANVIARSEDRVEIVPSRHSSNKMTVWVYALQNGKLAVDTDLQLDEPLILASRLNAVVGYREQAEVAAVRMGEMEYKVIQIVEPVVHAGDIHS